jgi:molybdate transport system ATP-binding protein
MARMRTGEAGKNAGALGARAADGPEPLVSLRGVAIRVGERTLFPDTTWVLHTGEHWGIVGANGSGKSLLARALCGRAQVLRGRVQYHFLADGQERDAQYGWFPTGTVMHVSADDYAELARPQLGFHQARWHASESATGATVRELLTRQSVEAINPYEVLPALDDPARFERRRADAVRVLGLEPLLDRRVVQLSSGELRKLVLARALARGPRLLVLDEPFAGLDASSRSLLRAALDELGRAGLTLVIATSRPEELPSCLRRVLFVRDHHVVSECDRAGAEALLRGAGVRAPAPRPRAPPAEEGVAVVDLREVTVRYGSVIALDRVTLRVAAGERWSITGPNGAGKTTLLSLILADHPQAYANHVEVFGRRRGAGESIWEVKARIGWVSPELHAHHPQHVCALDVVGSGFFASIGLHSPLGRERETRARALLEGFVPGSASRTLGELSHGTQRLVLLARALVSDPPLLVLDEPCHGLDAAARGRVLEAIDTAVGERTALVFVTHQPDELPSSISHVLELRAGRVVRSGPR